MLVVLVMSLNIQAQDVIHEANGLIEKGDITRAKAVLGEKLNKFPNDVKVISLLGDIASFEKKWDVALDYYKILLNQDPTNAEYNFKYGGVLGLKAMNVSKLKAVIYIPAIKKHLEKAAELDPNHIKSRRALVEIYMQLPSFLGGNEVKAQEFANEVKGIATLEGALSQAFIWNLTGKKSEAKALVQKTIAQISNPLSSKDQNYLNYELGKVAAEYNTDLHKGLKLLNAYIANYNHKDLHSLEWAYYRKAQIQALLKNKIEANKNINKALALKGDFEEARLEKKKIQEL